MRRGYEPHSFNPLVEERRDLPDHLRQFHVSNQAPDAVVADLVVLAIDALEVAIGEKNIAYALTPADGRLFSPVDADRSNVEPGIGPAKTRFCIQPVGMAVPRAQCTIFEFFQGAGKGVIIQSSGVFFRYFWQLKCKTTDNDD